MDRESSLAPNQSLLLKQSLESFPEERIQQELPLTRNRSLANKKKVHEGDIHWPATSSTRHRLVMKCDKEKTQEECLSSLLSLAAYEDSIRVIHNLAAIHAYSIEVDDKTRDTLFAGSFELHRDFVRHPLVMDGSMEHRRDLEDANAGQQIPWGVEFIRAMGVWDEFGVRGEGVKVCILDTGVDASHEDFTDLNLSGYSGDESMAPWDEYSNRGHGTHILGTIAASDNDIGIV